MKKLTFRKFRLSDILSEDLNSLAKGFGCDSVSKVSLKAFLNESLAYGNNIS